MLQRSTDVILKREYQIGWLCNMEVGGGTHDRWLARLFSLRFTPQSRISAYANANNIHENRKPGRNGEWWPSDIGNGTSTTESGGLDYRIDDKANRWSLQGDANVSHTVTDTETRQSQELFQTSCNMFSRSKQTGESHYTNFATNHHFRFNLGPEDNRHRLELHVRPQFNYTYSKSLYNTFAAEFMDDLSDLDKWESLFYSPNADNALLSVLVNKVENGQRSNATNYGGGVTAEMSYAIPYTPYIVGVNAGINAGRSKNHSYSLYNLENTAGNDHRNRYFDQPADNLNAQAGVNVTIPFDQNWDWVATAAVNYNYTHDKKENSLYRLDWLGEMADAELGTLPSTPESLLRALDVANSYLTENDKHQITASFNGRYDNNIYRNDNKYARFRFTWKAGLTLHTEEWHYDGQVSHPDCRTAWLPSFGLEVLRNTPGMKHELELQTAYRQQLPSMFSLMGLRFDSDPLNISEGNAKLHRTGVFSAIFFYRSGSWLAKKQRSLSADIRLYAYRNAVATAQTYNTATGVRTYRPENVNGNWNLNTTAAFYTPLGKRGFSINISLSDQFYHSVDLTGADSQTPVRSTVCTNYLSLPVRVNYSRNKTKLGIRTQVAWNHAESKRTGFQSIDAADISMGVNGNIALPWSMQLATDFTYFIRRGYSNNAMNTDDIVWNAPLSKSILHGRLTFSLVGYDILGQLSNITYTVNAQGNTETWRNVIPRYAMLRVSYKFNKQPKRR